MIKRLLKNFVVLGYLVHVVFASLFSLWENGSEEVYASDFSQTQADIDAMRGAVSDLPFGDVNEKALVYETLQVDSNTGESLSGEFVLTTEQTISENILTGVDNGFFSGSGEIVDEVMIDEMMQADFLLHNGFERNQGKYKKFVDDALIGNGDLDLSAQKGKFMQKIVLKNRQDVALNKSSQKYGNSMEHRACKADRVFVVLPEGAIAYREDGDSYKKTLFAPKIHDLGVTYSGENYQIVFSVGADEPVHFCYADGSPAYADFYVCVEDDFGVNSLPVYFSQYGNAWSFLSASAFVEMENNRFVHFVADHFTYFAIGSSQGSFSINNDADSTLTATVTLNNDAFGATQMRFGNSIAQRDIAPWVSYATSYPWTLDTVSGDGQKRVYAQFSGDGIVRNVADSIMLDATSQVLTNGLVTHLDASYLGTTFYDIAGSSNNFTASAVGVNGLWFGEPIMLFDGAKFLSRLTTPAISGTPFTISAWVKPDRVTGVQALVFRGRSSVATRYYGIRLNGTTFQTVARNNGGERVASSSVVAQVGQWYHVVGVFNTNGSRTIYVNGTQGTTNTTNITLDNSSVRWTVAKYPGTNTSYFSGAVDEVRIYNRGLSATEVQNLYMRVPSFDMLKTHTGGPMLYGGLASKISQVSVRIGGNTYATTASGAATWKTTSLAPVLSNGTYAVNLDYTNVYGRTGTVSYANALTIDTTTPYVIFEPNLPILAGPAFAVLTGMDPTYMVVNNGGSDRFVFMENGVFDFVVADKFGNTGSRQAMVDWIDASLSGNGVLTYDTKVFHENMSANDGSVQNYLQVSLTGDSFRSTVSGYVSFANVPAGLTPQVYYVSGSLVRIGLSGTAISHVNANDINNIQISFGSGAFLINYPGGVSGALGTDVSVDFLDSYSANGMTPLYDTTLDADTEPSNGCDNGVCQEANYGGLAYSEVSAFGSVTLQKYDLSNIPVGAQIYGATLRLTKYAYGYDATTFKVRRVINNPGWIEGRGNVGGANALKSLPGEPSYKQRKRQQENWYNGDPGFVEGEDYTEENLTDGIYFAPAGTVTNTFNFNGSGIAVLQDWLDNPSTNHGLAFVQADVERMDIATKEAGTVGNRPLLTVYYLGDTMSPHTVNLSPANGEKILPVDVDLSFVFDEYIFAGTGYLYVKRLTGDVVEKQIAITDPGVVIDNDAIFIPLSGSLPGGVDYYVTVDPGFVVDRAGNSFTGISLNTVWNFSTTDVDRAPVITGSFATGVTQSSGILGGDLLSTGFSDIYERGVFWSTASIFSPSDANKVFVTGAWDALGSFSFPVDGLPAGLWIYYRPYATNSHGIGYGPVALFLMKPANPQILMAEEVSNRSFLARWKAVVGADSYVLYLSTDPTFSSYVTGYGPKEPIFAYEYLISNLDPETTYYYKVVAQNSAGVSDFSNVGTVTTTYLPFPVMHLKLEEAGGAIAYDSASNHDAILDGSIGFQQVGLDGYGYYMNGAEDQITVVDFAYGPDLTVQLWFKDTVNTATEYLFSHGALTDVNSLNVFLDGTTQTLKAYFNGQLLFELGGQVYADLLDGDWHMYTLTIDDNYATSGKKKIAMYIDGEQVAINADVDAGPYNPGPENLTMGRRSESTPGTYYDGYFDDIRIYNTYLFDYEVASIYDALYNENHLPYVVSTSPASGVVDVFLDEVIAIDFSKMILPSSVENTGVISFSPSLSGVWFEWSGTTLFVHHDDFEYLTDYTVTVGTGVQDLSGNYMTAPYSFSFRIQNNVWLSYEPEVFSEALQNDGSIANQIQIVSHGVQLNPGVISSGFVSANNVSSGLQAVFVLNSPTQITVSLSGKALNHRDLDDVNILGIVFTGDAFSGFLATEVSQSVKSNLSIDFEDPTTLGQYPVKDTTLDILTPTYNYGLANYHIVGGGNFVAIEFDLSVLPTGATINSAILSFSKIDGSGTGFYVGKMINNADWVEGTKVGGLASAGESTYNQSNHSFANWYNGAAGLVAGVDYDPTFLVDPVVFDGNGTRILSLNASGLDVLRDWFENPAHNEGFLLYGGDQRLQLASKENPLESLRPTLLVNYTPAPPDIIPPTAYAVYTSDAGQYTGGFVTATLTGFSEDIIITNNGGSAQYLFTQNGSFLFEFEDLAWNTGSFLAVVNWIDMQAPILSNISTQPGSPIPNTGVDVNVLIDFDSDEYPIYIVYNLYNASGDIVDTQGTFELTGAGALPMVYAFPGATLSGGIYQLYAQVEDQYGNATGMYIADFVVSLGSVSIGVDSGYLFDQVLFSSGVEQVVEAQFSGYFRIDDPLGMDNGRYTTLSITDLSGAISRIENTGIFIKASGVELLDGVGNPLVQIHSGISDYVPFDGLVTYLQRTTGVNGGLIGKYGNKPWLKIFVPPYIDVDTYQATITYTLYEN